MQEMSNAMVNGSLDAIKEKEFSKADRIRCTDEHNRSADPTEREGVDNRKSRRAAAAQYRKQAVGRQHRTKA